MNAGAITSENRMIKRWLTILGVSVLLGGVMAALALGPKGRRPQKEHPQVAAPVFNPEQVLQQAYDHFYNLEYGQSLEDFEQLRQRKPEDASIWNHIAQVRLYQEMYRVRALESQMYGHGDPFLQTKLPPPSPQVEQAFERDNNQALQLAQAEVAAHPDDAHAHYNLAAVWALRGTYDFVLQRAYFSALRDALKARREADQAVKLEPGFVDPLLIVGAQNYIAGSLPWTVKVFAAMTGYSGSKQKGVAQIRQVAAHGENGKTDALILLSVIYRREGWNRDVLPILQQLVTEYPRNVLFAVEQAEATEAAGIHDVAMREYEAIVARAHSGAAGYEKAPLDKVWYDIGNIHRLFSRYPEAVAAYRQSLEAPGAQLRYRQAAALAAGQVYDLMGKRQQALAEYQVCLNLSPDSNAGRAARRWMDRPFRASH